MTAEPVRFDLQSGIAGIVLSRPEKRNAIDQRTLALLREYMDRADADPEVRVVTVSGEGPLFCAGADLGYVEDRLQSRETYERFLLDWHETFSRVAGCKKPTIAVVQGAALAGGFELTQVCDFVIAGASSVYGDQHAALGLFPGGGSTQRLPRLIGQRQAKWLLISGERIDAAEAKRLGLVNVVVADGDLEATAVETARRLATLSTSANQLIKTAVDEGLTLDLTRGLALERALALEHMFTEDVRIGLMAFAERQQPIFGGAPTAARGNGVVS